MVDQSGYTTNYVYDAAGRLAALTDGSNSAIVTYMYDAASRLTRQDYANGTYTTYQYDAAWNLTHLINFAANGTVNSRYDYSYNLLNPVTSMATLDGTWTYTCDAAGQLTRAIFTSANPQISPTKIYRTAMTQPAIGSARSSMVSPPTTSANSMDEYTSVGGTLQQYDSDGNLIVDGTNTYTYNQLDELTSVATRQNTSRVHVQLSGPARRLQVERRDDAIPDLSRRAWAISLPNTKDSSGNLFAHFQLRVDIGQSNVARLG